MKILSYVSVCTDQCLALLSLLLGQDLQHCRPPPCRGEDHLQDPPPPARTRATTGLISVTLDWFCLTWTFM
jgi:hypothetical protein